MIIVRAPTRISFAGGGTDLPEYYEQHGGMVVSGAIDRYFYVLLRASSIATELDLYSSDYQTYMHSATADDESNHPLMLPRAVLESFQVRGGLSIMLASEVVPGTGLGLSSSVAVALVKALSVVIPKPMTASEIAAAASDVELVRLRLPIGRQDAYASAFGGINAITFARAGVTVSPLRLESSMIDQLESYLVLLFTGVSRDSSRILREQRDSTARSQPAVLERLHALKKIAEEVRSLLEGGHIGELGSLLHDAWMQKRLLHPGITNPSIDDLYETARECGALGGKLLGAGGGGFLLLFVPPERREQMLRCARVKGALPLPFKFVKQGPEVLVDDGYRLGGASVSGFA